MSKFNFFNRIVINTTNFTLGGSWSFNSAGLILLVESTSSLDIIEYSFDGTTVHGDLTPGTPSQGISFDNRHECTVFLRRSFEGGDVTVRIESWA